MKRRILSTLLVLCMVLGTSPLVGVAAQGYAFSVKPEDTATRENVLEVLRQYDDGAYHIMTAKSGTDFMTWFHGGSIISGIDTSVHETYHGYTHSQSDGFYGEMIYLGDGKSYDVDYSVVYKGGTFTKTEEMAKQIPSQLQTFRYKTYVAPGASADANTKGVFGLLNEFSAYYWGLKTMNSLSQFLIDSNSGFESWEEYVTSIGNNMTAYAEFKYWTLRYMLYIKSANPALYQAILDNQNYCAAYRDADAAFTSEIARSKEIINSSAEYMRAKGFSVDWSDSGIYLRSGTTGSNWGGEYFGPWDDWDDDFFGSLGDLYFSTLGGSFSGSGLGLDDYNKLMAELKTAEYAAMDSTLKNAGSNQTMTSSVGFSDVPAGAYYYDAVTWGVEQGITSGTSAAVFSPNSNCTVAQILTFLWRASGSPAPTGSNPFSNVKNSDYYAAAAAWAYETGIVSGKTFGGNTPCTRSMAVTYMWKAAGSPSAKAADFTDVPTGADYAQAVAWAVERGVTSGTGAGTFSPNSICTRAQIVTFLYRDRVGGPSHDASGTPEAVSDGGTAAFTPVPMKDLVNLRSLQKKATDEQLAQAYAEAVKLVTPYAGLSLEQQLQGVASALRQRFEDGMEYSMMSSHYNDPYGYFIEGSASCAGCTRATGLCLNILGIPYEHVNENQYSHQWCRVNVNGTYWICDAYGLYCGPEPSPYAHPYFQ